MIVLIIALTQLISSDGFVAMADDAYYYLLVARNILELGESSALQGVPTNGYHPVWLILLTLLGSIFGFNLIAIRLLEIALFIGASFMLLNGLNIRKFSYALFFILALYHVCTQVAFNGMETSLLVFTAATFAVVLLKNDYATERRHIFLLFLTAGLTIGTRLDAALFVLPAILLMPRSLRFRCTVLSSLALAGAIYVVTNFFLFGTGTPISGRIKALGDVSINEAYISQLSQLINSNLPFTFASANWVITPWVLSAMALMLIFVSKLLPTVAQKTSSKVLLVAERRALIAVVVGCAFFFSHLLFNSSWRIWAWYGYPSIFLVIFGFALAHRALGEIDGIRWVAGVAVAIMSYWNVSDWVKADSQPYFYALNRLAVNQISDKIAENPIAMGDRAGSLGWFMGTGLYQLEGLVNSTEYFEALEKTDDLRPLLCATRITHVFDYEPDLGQYDGHSVPVFRSELTSFEGPIITVKSDEQIGVFNYQDLGIAKPDWLSDPNLYVWRLDCSSEP